VFIIGTRASRPGTYRTSAPNKKSRRVFATGIAGLSPLRTRTTRKAERRTGSGRGPRMIRLQGRRT
jgi:hypothetical protein